MTYEERVAHSEGRRQALQDVKARMESDNAEWRNIYAFVCLLLQEEEDKIAQN